MAQTTFEPFPAADLESNRAGRLTRNQRSAYRDQERGARKDRVILALILAGIAALIATSHGPTTNALERPAFTAAFIAGSVLCLYLGLFATDSLTRDLRSGAVQSAEGAIGKHTSTYRGEHNSYTTHYLEVGGRDWEVAGLTYDAAPDAGWVRLYYLPKSHKVVNLERLPDRPATSRAILPTAGTFVATAPPVAPTGGAAVPAASAVPAVPAASAVPAVPAVPAADNFMPISGPLAPKTGPTAPAGAAAGPFPSPETATQLIGAMAAAYRSHDREAINEVRAESAAMEHAMKDQMARAAVRPPQEQLDRRPLAQAILGRWTMGPMSMAFMPDGTMVVTVPGGREKRGSWSIGADGKLHSNADGRDQASDAWVAGDTLTLSEDGRGMPFHRIAGS